MYLQNLKKENINIDDVDIIDDHLSDCSSYGYVECVKYLVEEKNADIDIWTGYPLAVYSKNGHIEIVKYLVERGADVNADRKGISPLVMAVVGNQLDVVKYLVENGAKISSSVLNSTFRDNNTRDYLIEEYKEQEKKKSPLKQAYKKGMKFLKSFRK